MKSKKRKQKQSRLWKEVLDTVEAFLINPDYAPDPDHVQLYITTKDGGIVELHIGYDDDLQAIVTTIGADKKGSVYLADNWEFIGQTAGLPKERKSFSFKWDQGKEHLKTETGWIDGKDRKRIFITTKLKDKILRSTLDEFF